MKEKDLIIMLLIICATIVTLLYVYVLYKKVAKIKVTNAKVDEVHNYIHKGAMTFLTREYKVIIPFVIGFAALSKGLSPMEMATMCRYCCLIQGERISMGRRSACDCLRLPTG